MFDKREHRKKQRWTAIYSVDFAPVDGEIALVEKFANGERMMTEGVECVAEYEWSVEDVSLHRIAVWQSSDQKWLVTSAGAGSTKDLFDRTKAYFATLEENVERYVMETFFAAPGKMALFEVEKEGLRKAVAVKLKAYRTLPAFVGEALTPDTDTVGGTRWLFEAHPALVETFPFDDGCGHWDTPRFLNTCARFGFDPDLIRPRFRAPFEALAEELLCWVFDCYDGQEFLVFGAENEVLFDVLDLMRSDLLPSSILLDRAREGWSKLDLKRFPHIDALARLLATDELLCVGDERHGTMAESVCSNVVWIYRRRGAVKEEE